MTTVLCNEARTAKKSHICIWCGEPINPGERYRYQRIIFEREPQSNSWHPECFNAASQRDLIEGFEPHSGERPRAQKQEVPQ